MRRQPNLQALAGLQMELPLSWPDSLSSGFKKAETNSGANRYRPSNDDDPFTRARGYIPPHGRSRADYAKRVE